MKRLFDVTLSIVVLVLLLPLILVVTCGIRLDGGPAFYTQVRVGQLGRTFELFKFRSMVENADQIGGHATAPGDNRITAIGRFIRRSSVDELPQLLNVIRGDMSLVGPRPNVPAQVHEYTDAQWKKRNQVLPGITGLAQATRRSMATWNERYDLDLEYVNNRSFFFDLKIILLTVRQVFFRGGY